MVQILRISVSFKKILKYTRQDYIFIRIFIHCTLINIHFDQLRHFVNGLYNLKNGADISRFCY